MGITRELLLIKVPFNRGGVQETRFVYILKNSYFLGKLKYPVITPEMNKNVGFLCHCSAHILCESHQMPVSLE